jgi:hypothetical protein
VRERLRRYRDAGMTMLRVQLQGDTATDLDRPLDGLGRVLALAADVNAEDDQPMARRH